MSKVNIQKKTFTDADTFLQDRVGGSSRCRRRVEGITTDIMWQFQPPHNVACRFTAPRCSELVSQHRKFLHFRKWNMHFWLLYRVMLFYRIKFIPCDITFLAATT